MSSKEGPTGPKPSFSRGPAGGIGAPEDDRAGCEYHTPNGECGGAGASYRIGGIRVELCPSHLEAVLEENDRSQTEVQA